MKITKLGVEWELTHENHSKETGTIQVWRTTETLLPMTAQSDDINGFYGVRFDFNADIEQLTKCCRSLKELKSVEMIGGVNE